MSGDSTVVVHPLFQEEDDGSIPISPLQLTLSVIEARLAQTLNAAWHSRLPETHLGNIVGHPISVCYGAHFRNRWYAVAIWTTPIAANRLTDGWSCLELRRLAISDAAPKNTATRLLRLMRLMIARRYGSITKLLSYQDTDVHTGTIYKAAGWRIGARSAYVTWGSEQSGRSHVYENQATGDKIRWEYSLRTLPL